MARTKQTARKSNGGSAPKYDLAAAEAAAQAQVVVPAPPTKRQKIAPYFDLPPASDKNNGMVLWMRGRWHAYQKSTTSSCFIAQNVGSLGLRRFPPGKKAVIPKQTALAPYQGFWKHGRPLGVVRYLGNQSLRGQWPIIDTARTVIISIHLEGGRHRRESPQQLKLCELVFNLHDTKKRNAFHRKIQGCVADLEEFKPETVLIFVTTHSTPDTGDLWIEPKGLAASPVHQVLPILIPSRLQAEVSAFVKTAKIQYAIGFTVEHFLPAAANTFLQDTVHAFFIARYGKSFARILASHCELGIHTDILMYFEDGDVFRYSWHHSGRHPFGQSVPHQCPKCFVVSSLRVSLDEESRVVLRCPVKTCDYVKTIDKAVQQIRVEEEPWKKKDTSVRGAWYGDWVSFKNGRGFKAPTFGDKEVAA
ncbi:hypothetical protein MSAN_00247900 [Mycena sanguinolenta]|uniref:Uncharacterized protein n=1 Tax=Mycena sanguinolenta TaxID=230812 RepID=A0A8H6ZMK7_9AGAR|nr:hypothetical protein MSAN_00247900 [Mycena sanguinolenta]